MAYRPPAAVFDACVLYPFHTRNILVQCAVDRLVNVRWTDEIHDEWMRNLAANTPGLSMDRLRRTRDLMKAAVLTADVQEYARHVQSITLPDPNDRHVVAAANAGGASVVVTWNIRDFPEAELARHGLRRETPDQFLLGLHAAAPRAVLASAANARLNLRVSTPTAGDFVAALDQQGLVGFAAILRDHVADV
jgi:predicted nucleic acid-binding protein